MNQKRYKIKHDIKLFLNEVKENAKLVYQDMESKKKIDKNTIKYNLLDIEETIEVIESLVNELENEYENEQL